MSRSRRPVRLTITVVPKLTPVSEKPGKNPQKSFFTSLLILPRISPNFLNPFSISYFSFFYFLLSLFFFFFLFFLILFPPSFSPRLLLPSADRAWLPLRARALASVQRPLPSSGCLADQLTGATRQASPAPPTEAPPSRVAPPPIP
jgi:hypothetical protein